MVSAANPNELAEQNLTPGDLSFPEGRTLPFPAAPDGEHIEGGTPVQFDEDGYIEPVVGDPGDEDIGIVLSRADESDDIRLTDESGDDNYYSVHVNALPVVVEVDDVTDVTRGDLVQTDGASGWAIDAEGDYPVYEVTDEAANQVAIGYYQS